MQLENSFLIQAPPDRVFAYLLEPRNVVGCVPGAELTEEIDATTFKGKVKIKVGPITVAYSGTARLLDRNDEQRTAVLEGEGRETTGPGSGRGKATMNVEADGDGSLVKVITEFTLTGRVAQFGRGVIEDVSKRMVREVAACLQANLQLPEPPESQVPTETGDDSGEAAAPPPPPPPAASASEINAASLVFSVMWDQVTSPGFWDAGIKMLDEMMTGVETRVERLTARYERLLETQPK